MEHNFSVRESLKFGWSETKAHNALLFQVMLTFFALQITSAALDHMLSHSPLGIASSIILTLIGIWISAGFVLIALKLAEGHTAHYADLFPPMKTVWRFFLTGVVAGVLIAAGFILLIIPGVYLALRFSMARFALLDTTLTHQHYIKESLRKSSEMTQDIKWRLLGFFAILILLNIIGALLLLVGLLVTVPVTMLAYAHLYLKLKNSVESK